MAAAPASMLTNLVKALDPRPGGSWGRWEALRTPAVVTLAVGVWAAYFWLDAPFPQDVCWALTATAGSILGLDTGLLAPQKKA